MLPDVTVTVSLAGLMDALRPCFTARSFVTFAPWWRGWPGRCAAARYAGCCWARGYGGLAA